MAVPQGSTSDAAAVGGGLAALMVSVNPSLTPEQMKAAMVNGIDVLPSMQGKVASNVSAVCYLFLFYLRSCQAPWDSLSVCTVPQADAVGCQSDNTRLTLRLLWGRFLAGALPCMLDAGAALCRDASTLRRRLPISRARGWCKRPRPLPTRAGCVRPCSCGTRPGLPRAWAVP